MPEIVRVIEFRDRDGVFGAWRWKPDDVTSVTKWDQLTVRENQQCVLMQDGKVQQTLGPGRYILDSMNFPIITRFLTGLVYGRGVTPFLGDLYFINTTQFNARRWGSASPVYILDELYGQIPVTANGTVGFVVSESSAFLHKVVGTQDHVSVEALDKLVREAVVVPAFVDAVVSLSKSKFQDVVNARSLVTSELSDRCGSILRDYGMGLTGLTINSIGTTSEFEAIMADAALSRARASASAFGIGKVTDAQTEAERKLGEVGSSYREVTMADAMKAAAGAGGGGGGGLLAAMLLAQMPTNRASDAGSAPGPASPPPLPGAGAAVVYHVAVNGQQLGPFPPAVLQQMIPAGTLTASTLVWRPGLADWQAASTVLELAGLFTPPLTAPPPVPPGA